MSIYCTVENFCKLDLTARDRAWIQAWPRKRSYSAQSLDPAAPTLHSAAAAWICRKVQDARPSLD